MDDRSLLLSLAGPALAGYLDDARVIEVLVNPNGTCFVERFGAGMQASAPPAPGDLDRFLGAIAHRTQQEWRDQSPSLHAALADLGWRIQACRPPQAPGLTMALRKHPQQIFSLARYREQGMLTDAQDTVLRDLLRTKARMLIGGATGSAKTSLLNACLDFLSATGERQCILEDDPELMTSAPNAVFFRTRPGVPMSQLVMDALRYRPDRLIIGEMRVGVAAALCWAFETGHSGLSTLHAESAEAIAPCVEGMLRRETSDGQPALVGRVLDAVVHLRRDPERGLQCTQILGVYGYTQGVYRTEPLA